MSDGGRSVSVPNVPEFILKPSVANITILVSVDSLLVVLFVNLSHEFSYAVIVAVPLFFPVTKVGVLNLFEVVFDCTTGRKVGCC